MKTLLLIITFFLTCYSSSYALAGGIEEADSDLAVTNPKAQGKRTSNQLADSICQIILLLNGRIGRAVAIIVLIGLSFMFMASKASGQLSVPAFLTIVVGMTVLFAAKPIALVLLPNYVRVKDTDRNTYVKKTPDELLREACPELK